MIYSCHPKLAGYQDVWNSGVCTNFVGLQCEPLLVSKEMGSSLISSYFSPSPRNIFPKISVMQEYQAGGSSYFVSSVNKNIDRSHPSRLQLH